MPELQFEGNRYQVDDYDTVLNTLLKNGHAVPNFCRSGICHSCMMKAEEGTPLPFTQIGLNEDLVEENYFLTCQCAVYAPMKIARPAREKRTRFVAMVRDKQRVADNVARILLSPEHEFVYQAGQFTTLTNVEGLSGDFPIASIHSGEEGDGLMEFHIQNHSDQPLNRYLFSELEVGDGVEIQTALGDCYYQPHQPEREIVVIGVDSSLASGLSYVRQALKQGHQGRITLIFLTFRLDENYVVQVVDGALRDSASLYQQQVRHRDEILPIVQEQLRSLCLTDSALILAATDQSLVAGLRTLSKQWTFASLAVD